jgi:hypothetical protein
MMDIDINGQPVADFTARDGAPMFREFRVEGAIFAGHEVSTIRLFHPYAGNPSQHSDIQDTRRIAFAFRRLTLVRVLDEG